MNLSLSFCLTWALFLIPAGYCNNISSLSQSVFNLLKLTVKPTDISLMICHPYLQLQLLQNLTLESSSTLEYFTGKHKTVTSLGGQETAFIIVDLKCTPQRVQRVLQTSPLNVLYSRWLIVDSGHPLGAVDEQLLQSVLLDTPIAQSTELFYFKETTTEAILLKQAYKRLKVDNSTVILEDYGTFSRANDGTFLNLRPTNTTTIRRKDMNGSVFQLAIALEDPDSINHLNNLDRPEIDPLSKNGLRLAEVIMEHMGTTIEFVVSGGWGQAYPAGNNWTGMLGDMLAGKSEFAATPTLVRESRLEAVDYLSYSVQTFSKIVFRAPKLSYTTNVFLLPFDKIVWICALFLVSVIVGLLLVSTWTEWNVLVPANALDPNRDMLTPQISDVVFLILGNVFVQGSPVTPRSTAGRIIILFCLIFIVCLYVSYCAFIVALLQSPANNIKTVADLLNSYIHVGNQDTVYFRFWLARLTDPMERQLYEKKILNKGGTDNFYPLEEGVQKMKKGLFALHMETPVGYRLVSKYFSENEKCDLREIPFANIRSPHFVSRKHSAFKEFFRIMTLRIKENGVQNRLWTEVYVKKPKCTQQGNFIPLALMDVSPVIFAFLGGITLSLCVFLLELLIHKYARGMCRLEMEI